MKTFYGFMSTVALLFATYAVATDRGWGEAIYTLLLAIYFKICDRASKKVDK